MALVISATAKTSVNIQNEAEIAPTRLRQIAYTTRPGSITQRMPQRSIMRPRTGTARAEKIPPTESANDTLLRCHPVSAIMGFRNTPKVNPRTGPLQTNKPVTAPKTTHQGLVNLNPMVPPPLSFRPMRAQWSGRA